MRRQDVVTIIGLTRSPDVTEIVRSLLAMHAEIKRMSPGPQVDLLLQEVGLWALEAGQALGIVRSDEVQVPFFDVLYDDGTDAITVCYRVQRFTTDIKVTPIAVTPKRTTQLQEVSP